MKTRSDFVSNSSSSSFILKDAGFFKHFNITVDDIRNAILELYGGKDAYEMQLQKSIRDCDYQLNAQKTDDSIKKYYVERKAKLLKEGLDLWVAYDMKDPKERKKCFKEWDLHFASWLAPNEGHVDYWETFEEIVNHTLNAVDFSISSFDDKKELKSFDFKTHKNLPLPSGSKAFCKCVKDALDVKSMKEVLHDDNATLMIHFSDNIVYELAGMQEYGKDDASEYYEKRHADACKNSKWDSESSSKYRFFEILIKYFIKKGKVDLSDKKFMEYWKVPENHWWKKDKKYKDKKYFTKSDDTATWKDVVDDMLNENSIMHEG